ncbi:MAG: DUF4268 domain-containing protein [Alphaproteobacteria bacterium]|nr:DUF4268 domain-containing protein [Alphaproteobacteria bacterium]
MTELGNLERISLRGVWATEDGHFTPWLAKADNIVVLGNAINLTLVVEDVEHFVGAYRADIICRNTSDESLVLVENQLTKSDHKHLGQILTYAAGTKAKTVIWIAEKFTDEHREAIDWLNNNTSDGVDFFGLEIELWSIDGSVPAPKFNVVSEPNEWLRSVSRAAKRISETSLTDTRDLYLRYWTQFQDLLERRQSPLSPGRKPRPDHCYAFKIGRSEFELRAILSARESKIGVDIRIHTEKAARYFNVLLNFRDEIEQEIGEEFDWEELPEQNASRIMLFSDQDPKDEAAWVLQQSWLIEKLEKMKEVFEPWIKSPSLDGQ